MKPVAFLDANVIVAYGLTCVLLQLAEAEVIDVRWSNEVLEEAGRAMQGPLGLESKKAARRLAAMRSGFPDAEVVGYEVQAKGLVSHPKDRHVFAAAAAAKATHLLTANIQDFAEDDAKSANIEVVHPDEFLLDLLGTEPVLLYRAIAREAALRKAGSAITEELLDSLQNVVPGLVEALRPHTFELSTLTGWYKKPHEPITSDKAAARVFAYLRERAGAGVLFAEGFTSACVTDEGALQVTWDGDKTVDGPLLQKLNPFDNLAHWVATPLSFNNEEGRQIRQHVRTIEFYGKGYVIGTMTSQEAYARGTGVPLGWLP